MNDFDFRNVSGHVEVFLNGEFLFSADTRREAVEELSKIIKLNVILV